MRTRTVIFLPLLVWEQNYVSALSVVNRAKRTLLNYRDREAHEEHVVPITAPTAIVGDRSLSDEQPDREYAALFSKAGVVFGVGLVPLLLGGGWDDWNVMLLPLGVLGAIPLILRPLPHRCRFLIQDSSMKLYGSNTKVLGRMGLETCTSALADEVVYRFYLVYLLRCLTESSAIAVLLQAILYARKEGHEEGFLAGLWYSLLASATGSLLPAMIAHVCVDWHRHAVVHREAVRQIEYVDNCNPQSPVERIFCAFDSRHCGTLSRQDVERALAYAQLPSHNSLPQSCTYNEFEVILKKQHKEMLQRTTRRDE